MNLAKLINEYTRVKAALVNQTRVELQAEFHKFFQENPEVKLIYWTQYTPYFNDGEDCVFSVYDLCFFNASGEEVEENLMQIDSYDREDSAYYLSKDNANIATLEREFTNIPDEIMKEVFGDHAEIFVTPEEIRIETYEHD